MNEKAQWAPSQKQKRLSQGKELARRQRGKGDIRCHSN
jgi:hypothetical protein